MKKKLILMSALFAGSMIVNDGLGAKILIVKDQHITDVNPNTPMAQQNPVQVVDYVAMRTEMQNAFEAANSVIENYADNPMEDPVTVYAAIINFNSTYETRRNRQGVDRTTFDREFSHFPADLIKKFRDSVASKTRKECEAEILQEAKYDNMDQMMKDVQDFRIFNDEMMDGCEIVVEEVEKIVAEEERETNLTLIDSEDTETSPLSEMNVKELLKDKMVEKIKNATTYEEIINAVDVKQYAKLEVEGIIDNTALGVEITTALKNEVDDALLGEVYTNVIHDKTITTTRKGFLKELLKDKMVEKITSMQNFTEFVKTTDDMIKQYAKQEVEKIIDDKIKAPIRAAVNAALKDEVKDGLNAAMAECQTVYNNKRAELMANEKKILSEKHIMTGRDYLKRLHQFRKEQRKKG